MGSVTDELLGATQPAESAKVVSGSVTDELLNGAPSVPVSGAPSVPVYGSRKGPLNDLGVPFDSKVKSGPNVGIGGEFVAGFRSDDAEGLRYYAQKLFPKEPIDEAVKRFTVTDKNRIVYRGDDGQYYAAQPSGGIQKTIGGIAEQAGKLIPTTASTIAGVVTAPMVTTGVGLAGSMAATATAGGMGEALRQKLGDYMMGDASTGDINKTDIAKETIMSGLGQGIGVGAGKIYERSQVRDIDRLSKDYMDKAYGEAGKRGISLTPGQATGLKTLQAEEKRLATRVPETIDQMGDFIAKQSDDVQSAWYKELDKIAPSKDAAEVGNSVRKVAQSALDDVTKARSDAARPLYESWAKNSGPVDTSSLIDGLASESKTAARGGATSRALNAVKGFLTEADGTPVTDPVKLHNARIEIGNMIDTRSVKGTSINNTIVGKLKGVMNGLTQAMDDASAVDGGVPLYKQARSTFSSLSDDVDDAFASSLKRIAGLNDTNILAATREAFNPSTRSPEMISKLRVKLSAKDPQAWRDLKRLWLQDEIGAKLNITESGDIANSAGKILKGLENHGFRRSVAAALTGVEKQNLEDLRFVLKRISSANIRMASDTAANAAADRLALKRAIPLWAKAQKALFNFWDVPKEIAEAAGDRKFVKQAKQMADIITSGNKDSMKAIKALRKLSPNEWRALAASGQFGVKGTRLAADAVLAPRPPSLDAQEAQPN